MGRFMGFFVCLLVVAALLGGASAATVYKVGDSLGWTVPPHTSYYSDWASTKTFFLGDQFDFNWTTGTHTVAEVSKADYDNCTKVSSAIASPFLFTPSAGSYYIICTVDDHCGRGQKLAFNISSTGSPAEAPTSSASSLSAGVLFAVLSTTAAYFLHYV